MLRYLVERLPAIITAAWVDTRSQPAEMIRRMARILDRRELLMGVTRRTHRYERPGVNSGSSSKGFDVAVRAALDGT